MENEINNFKRKIAEQVIKIAKSLSLTKNERYEFNSELGKGIIIKDLNKEVSRITKKLNPYIKGKKINEDKIKRDINLLAQMTINYQKVYNMNQNLEVQENQLQQLKKINKQQQLLLNIVGANKKVEGMGLFSVFKKVICGGRVIF